MIVGGEFMFVVGDCSVKLKVEQRAKYKGALCYELWSFDRVQRHERVREKQQRLVESSDVSLVGDGGEQGDMNVCRVKYKVGC